MEAITSGELDQKLFSGCAGDVSCSTPARDGTESRYGRLSGVFVLLPLLMNRLAHTFSKRRRRDILISGYFATFSLTMCSHSAGNQRGTVA